MGTCQVVQTDKYGALKVVKSFHEGPRVLHLLENGAYCFDTGLPVKDIKELRQAIPAQYLKEALDWWDNRHKMLENPPLRINILPNNTLVFDDGKPVTNIQDVIDYFEPGPFREAALIAFATKLAADKEAKGGAMDLQPKRLAGKPSGKSSAKTKQPTKAAQATPAPEAARAAG